MALDDAAARAIAERLFDPSVFVFEYDVLIAIEAIKALPATAITILEQRDIKLYPVNTGVTIDQVSPIYQLNLEKNYPDPALRAELIDKVSAAFVPAEHRIYIVDPHPGTIVHEVGHVVDDALSNRGWSSTSDNLLNGIHEQQSLNEYSRSAIHEAFAEWYRAWCDTPNPEAIEPNADDKNRDAITRNAPTAFLYLEAIDRAIELVLDVHPQAFAERRELSQEVVLRAQVAVSLGLSVDELSLEDLEVALGMLPEQPLSTVVLPPLDVAERSTRKRSVSVLEDREVVAASARDSANLPAERSALWRERFGIADDTFANGTTLNDLDDWAGFHDRLAATKRS